MGAKDGWMDGWIDGWMDGCMDGWMHAGMEAWMHECMGEWSMIMHDDACIDKYVKLRIQNHTHRLINTYISFSKLQSKST